MISQISPHARNAAVFGTLAVTFCAFMVFGTLAKLEFLSELKPLDMRPAGYRPSDVRILFESLGNSGRAYYFERQLLLDTFYPALLALTLSSIYRLLGKGMNFDRLARAGIAVSWLAACFDYAENACIAAMLNFWGDSPDSLAFFSSLFTITKSALTTLAATGVLTLLIWRLLHRKKPNDAVLPINKVVEKPSCCRRHKVQIAGPMGKFELPQNT